MTERALRIELADLEDDVAGLETRIQKIMNDLNISVLLFPRFF